MGRFISSMHCYIGYLSRYFFLVVFAAFLQSCLAVNNNFEGDAVRFDKAKENARIIDERENPPPPAPDPFDDFAVLSTHINDNFFVAKGCAECHGRDAADVKSDPSPIYNLPLFVDAEYRNDNPVIPSMWGFEDKPGFYNINGDFINCRVSSPDPACDDPGTYVDLTKENTGAGIDFSDRTVLYMKTYSECNCPVPSVGGVSPCHTDYAVDSCDGFGNGPDGVVPGISVSNEDRSTLERWIRIVGSWGQSGVRPTE